jgi:Leucine-rich repeat (LRR) protein
LAKAYLVFLQEDIDLDSLVVEIFNDSIVNIDLGSLSIIEIPQAVCELVNLREIRLGCNDIRRIENLDSLINLRKLHLGNNKITKINIFVKKFFSVNLRIIIWSTL